MARHQVHGRRCTFESLESRQMLAGDVTAKIVNGDLIIKGHNGDNSDNHISIAVAAGIVTITSADTTVNTASATAGVAIAGTLTGNIKVNLKGGTDRVSLTGTITVPGDLQIKKTETVTNTGTLTVDGDMDIEDVRILTLVEATVN